MEVKEESEKKKVRKPPAGSLNGSSHYFDHYKNNWL